MTRCEAGFHDTAGKSNSGEGGEDPIRWINLQDIDENGVSESLPHLKGLVTGDTATSRIKQVRRCTAGAPSPILTTLLITLLLIMPTIPVRPNPLLTSH